MHIYSVAKDSVINAIVGQGETTYQYALGNLYPLINRLGIQRKIQDQKFYDRLKRDIINGCVMPAITIAFISPDFNNTDSLDEIRLGNYIAANIESGFILDGIQRLNTLHRAREDEGDAFPNEKPLYFSVLICGSMDSLLYRMITLNNGQKPMTTRHQIEILSANLYDFSDAALPIRTEKNNERKRGTFKQADFVLAYLAFLSNSTTIDNQKLIEEKLDQLIAFKILETDPTKPTIEFKNVINKIDDLCEIQEIKDWFKNQNNLIGFSASIRKGYEAIKDESPAEFLETIHEFEMAFASFQVSKIKLGQARRNAVSAMTADYGSYSNLVHLEMVERMAEHI